MNILKNTELFNRYMLIMKITVYEIFNEKALKNKENNAIKMEYTYSKQKILRHLKKRKKFKSNTQ